MAKILITGAKGQLGQSLLEAASRFPCHSLVGYDIEGLDILDVDAVYREAKSQRAEALINCAAYTAVERAEREPDEAYFLNAKAVEGITETCRKLNLLLVHLSTDYVFDGKSFEPYKESDPPHPLSVYGASKLAGEAFVLKYGRGVVVRTSWLYSPYGDNFVASILRLSAKRDVIEVVDDQTGSPTYAPHLAEALLNMAGQLLAGPTPDSLMGLYHLSGSGACSRFELAQKIKETSGFEARIAPIPTSAYPSVAQRPACSVLHCEKVARVFGITLPSWQEGVGEYLENIENPIPISISKCNLR